MWVLNRFKIALWGYTRKESLPVIIGAMRTGGVLILLVDDDPSSLQEVSRMLSRHGHLVMVAENGAAGLEMFRLMGAHIHIVITDISMPIMDGITMAGWIKAMEPAVSILLMSELSMEEVQKLNHAKFVCIRKPLHSEELLRAVNTAAMKK